MVTQYRSTLHKKRQVKRAPPRWLTLFIRRLGWLIWAIDPWLRKKRQLCGFPVVWGDPEKDPICGKVAPFSFYCDDHQLPFLSRFYFWWRVGRK